MICGIRARLTSARMNVTTYSGPAIAKVTITKTADAQLSWLAATRSDSSVKLTNNSAFTATGLTFADNLPAAPGVNWIDRCRHDRYWLVGRGSPPNSEPGLQPEHAVWRHDDRAHVISATTVDTCGSTLNNMASYISNACPGSE